MKSAKISETSSKKSIIEVENVKKINKERSNNIRNVEQHNNETVFNGFSSWNPDPALLVGYQDKKESFYSSLKDGSVDPPMKVIKIVQISNKLFLN